jgi:hypothetical protein
MWLRQAQPPDNKKSPSFPKGFFLTDAVPELVEGTD